MQSRNFVGKGSLYFTATKKNKELIETIDLQMLNLSILGEDIKQVIIETWLSDNEIKFKQTASKQYKILNGCISNIMFYPSTSKVMVQDTGKNHVIQTSAKNILAIIKGNLAYKKVDK